MKRGGHCAGIGWAPAQTFDFSLQMPRELAALVGIVAENRLELRIAYVLGGRSMGWPPG